MYLNPRRDIFESYSSDLLWCRRTQTIANPKWVKAVKGNKDDIEDYSITDEQKFRMRIVRSHLDYIADTIVQVDSAIDTMVSELENTISLLRTIPGVDRNSAITVISEIGNDMSRFDPSKRLCCWAGLTPGNNESAGKKKSVRITHAGVYLKPALAQVAHPVVKATGISYYRLIKILFKKQFYTLLFLLNYDIIY